MGRAPCCSKVGLHRGPWTAREDALLINFIEAHGEGQWRSLPKKAGLLRCGKSCRLRWMNYLRPDIKRGNITPDEDDLIIRLHGLLGNRWSLIAGRLPGRTDNEIKNYWNTHLSKRLRSQGTDPNTHKKLSQVNLRKPSKNNKKRCRGSIGNFGNNKKQAQDLNHELHKMIMENKNEEASDHQERERTKIHLPKPVRVTSMISLTRNNSNGSLDTNMSTTSASSSQSQSQSQSQPQINRNQALLFDSVNTILDMPWLSNNDNMADGNGLEDLMMRGYCADDVDLDIIKPYHQDDDMAAPDNNPQLEKLYEEYLQLIKADHHKNDHDDDHDDDDNDDNNDDNQAQLDSFTESFLI